MPYANAIIAGSSPTARTLGRLLEQRSISYVVIDDEAIDVAKPMGGGYPGFHVVRRHDQDYGLALVETGATHCTRRATPGLFVLCGAAATDESAPMPTTDAVSLADLVADHVRNTPLVV